ncbi:GNAT family N-acetyltransferase [Flavihumibacter sp.]|uniref:GNAT family N-acetyltransferase n=1 Tax=Flavihumibacter sp. TaxID=1913981 RepID=UPI002FCA3EBD
MLQKFRNSFKQYGALNFPVVLLKSALQKFSIYIESFIVYGKKLNSIRSLNSPTGYLIREIDLEALKNAGSMHFNDSNISRFTERINSGGYSVFGAYKGDDLVAYAWMSMESIELPGFIRNHGLVPDEDEAYLLDAFCLPEHRGNGLQKVLLTARMNKVYQEGKGKVITIVRKENLSSRTAILKSGFRAERKLIFRRIGNNQQFLQKSVSSFNQ